MQARDRNLRVGMFLRSFLVQSSWNFERLQNLGFLLLVAPALSRRYGSRPELYGKALERHLELFNTHPYFAGLVAGAVVSEEGGKLDRGRFLGDLKRSLMSVLGSIGDGFFWAVLKPLAALLALVPALFGVSWAPLVLLAVFNVPHLAVRWWGVAAGLRYGCQVIRPIRSLPFSRLGPPLSKAAAVLAGAGAGIAACHPAWRPFPGEEAASLLAGLAVFAAAFLAGGKRGTAKEAGEK